MRNNSNIYILITGGFGNQLFQFLFAYSLKINHHYSKIVVCYDKSTKDRLHLTSFDYEKSDYSTFLKKMTGKQRFLYKLALSNNPLIKKLPFSLHNKANKKINIFLEKNGLVLYRDLIYREIKPKNKRNLFLMGYFEDKRYFNNFLDVSFLRKQLFNNDSNKAWNESIFSSIKKATNPVCVSVRCGDFMSDKYRKEFYVCDKYYFDRAIKLVQKKINNPTFFFFSDDIKWVRNNIMIPEGSFFESGNNNEVEKLFMKSSCRHFILSNSTFAWWAWYLSEKEGLVISPYSWKKTYQDSHLLDSSFMLI